MLKVIPEFDTPGHTLSWNKLLKVSECVPESHKSGQIPDASIDPTYENNYIVMNDLLKGWQGSTDSFCILLERFFETIFQKYRNYLLMNIYIWVVMKFRLIVG